MRGSRSSERAWGAKSLARSIFAMGARDSTNSRLLLRTEARSISGFGAIRKESARYPAAKAARTIVEMRTQIARIEGCVRSDTRLNLAQNGQEVVPKPLGFFLNP